MEEISNSSVDSVDWFLLVAYSKSWEERKKLNEELLSKKNLELEDLENSHPMILQKKKKKKLAPTTCSGGSTRGMAR